MLKFSGITVKTSKKDGHEYESVDVIVDGIKLGFVVKHSEVMFGVGLPAPHGKGRELFWKTFTSREDATSYVKENADKALRFFRQNGGERVEQQTFGL